MGLRKKQQLACLSLLLMIILIFKNPAFAVGYGRFNKFGTGFSSSEVNHGKQKQKQVYKSGNVEENGGNFFGDDKRKIHTGPNPLHNR